MINGRGGHLLVMRPGCREQTIVPPALGVSTQNLTLIGQAVSERKMFDIVDGDGRTDAGPCVYFKLTNEA